MCFLYSETSCWTIPHGRPLTIGRSEDNIVTIQDRFVSLFHCKIEVNTDHILIRDLGSRNGTFLNGKKIEVAALKDGDRIIVGKHLFFYSDNQTDLIVTWKDRFQVWLVRKQKLIRVFLAILPVMAIVGESYRGEIAKWLSILLELIQ